MKEISLIEKKHLASIPIDKTWSFADKTIKDTTYITHGYYTYPANLFLILLND